MKVYLSRVLVVLAAGLALTAFGCGEESSNNNQSDGGDAGDTITEGDTGTAAHGDTGDTSTATHGDTGDTGTATHGDTGDTGTATHGDTGDTSTATHGDTGDTSTATHGDTGDTSTATHGDTGDTSTATHGDTGDTSTATTGDTGSEVPCAPEFACVFSGGCALVGGAEVPGQTCPVANAVCCDIPASTDTGTDATTDTTPHCGAPYQCADLLTCAVNGTRIPDQTCDTFGLVCCDLTADTDTGTLTGTDSDTDTTVVNDCPYDCTNQLTCYFDNGTVDTDFSCGATGGVCCDAPASTDTGDTDTANDCTGNCTDQFSCFFNGGTVNPAMECADGGANDICCELPQDTDTDTDTSNDCPGDCSNRLICFFGGGTVNDAFDCIGNNVCCEN